MTVLEIIGAVTVVSWAALTLWAAVLAVSGWLERRRGLGRIERYANSQLADRLRDEEALDG